MPTTTVKTIGTTGDYSTLQAWEDACPADLVSADEIWRGEVLNETLLQSLTISGQTTDATRYVELTAQAGASFMDHADRTTRPLRFDPSYGATIRNDAPYGTVVSVSTAYTRINRLLIGDNTTGPTRALDMGSASTSRLENCIIKTSQTVSLGGGSSAIAANVFIHSTGGNLFWINSGSSILNCTFVRPSDLGNTTWGTINNYTSVTIKNTAVFGVSNFASVSFTGNNNASNASIGSGTSNQASLTYADQFEEASAASGTEDFRLKAGSDLIDTGADLSGSGVTTDIIGTARGATYDIGAWEVGSSDLTLSPGPGAVTYTGQAVTVRAGAVVAVGVGAATYTGQQASVAAGASVAVGAGAVAYQGHQVAVPEPVTVAVGHGTVAYQGQGARVLIGDDARALGGDDAPARREDIDRLARRRKRQEAEQAERAARLRQTLERAYKAATGAADDDAETAIADAVELAPPAMRERIADVAPMLGTAEALAELRAILVAIQDRRERLAREDDELALILAVL
jgi:hypothetical protein